MVSPLWKACSDSDYPLVLQILQDAATVDIELKDHTGATPLIEAVKKGNVDIVKALLDKGADPNNASSHGRPDQYTSDPLILDLLRAAQPKPAQSEPSVIEPTATAHSTSDSPEKRFYAPQSDAYPYYPTINPALSTVSEGLYYPPPQPQPAGDPSGIGNLPPPEIARLIPCRYFPACRYGAQCMFAHPQGPYYQAPAPPVQYPPYDPMVNPYVPAYYPPPPPPSFQQHHMNPMSPPPAPPMMHARSSSEVVSPAPGHFSPNGPPPPLPYGPLSPPVYSHPGQGPVPMHIPPLHSQPPHIQGPQSPTNLYNASTSPIPPFAVHQEGMGTYPPPGPPKNHFSDANGNMKMPDQFQGDNFNNIPPNQREVGNHHRRGSTRRPSFTARKPPCLFFPAGRCKNGDDCRFPHVVPENPAIHNNHHMRGGGPRPRGHMNGTHGFNGLDAKMGNLSVRDEPHAQKNGTEPSSRSHSSDAGNRPKFPAKHPHNGNHPNHFNNSKKMSTLKQQQHQRVPNADEFPVLAGTTTPPNRGTNGVTTNGGPTAAQVLQAPAPFRKDASKESSTRGTTPDPVRSYPAKQETRAEPNGIHPNNDPPAQEQPIVNGVNGVNKHPVMSFAAAATSAPSDVAKEVPVSA